MAIKLDSPGPVFFVQWRAGLEGRPFRMFKFRSMAVETESLLLSEIDVLAAKRASLKRVTRVGRWLRRWGLDELPQLWHVWCGEMSLVGPRSEDKEVVALYSPWQRQRLALKPGLTGPMQVNGRGLLSLDERVRLELAYLENYSLWVDVQILWQTIPAVLSGYGAF